MRVPSGDQAGLSDHPRIAVKFRGFVPSAFIVQMAGRPFRLLTNTTPEPSGDQSGCPSDATLFVSRITSGSAGVFAEALRAGTMRIPTKASTHAPIPRNKANLAFVAFFKEPRPAGKAIRTGAITSAGRTSARNR